MAMRKCLIGLIAGLAGAMALSSVASAAITGVSIESSVTPSKGDKKIRSGVSTFFASNDTHSGVLPCPAGNGNERRRVLPSRPRCRSVITFPTSLKFDPGNLPDCSLSSIVGQSSAGARAACPGSIVGSGSNTQLFSDGRTLNGTITAFNGAPSGGFPSLYLHVEFPGVATKPILNGIIRATC